MKPKRIETPLEFCEALLELIAFVKIKRNGPAKFFFDHTDYQRLRSVIRAAKRKAKR